MMQSNGGLWRSARGLRAGSCQGYHAEGYDHGICHDCTGQAQSFSRRREKMNGDYLALES